MYLLDTHIFLWWLKEDPKLKQTARDIVKDPKNTNFISSITIWEIALKSKLGKLRVPTDIADYISRSGFEELPITSSHAIHTRNLHFHHRDPFDRMLISQAKLENLTILTRDKIFKKYPVKVELV